jgi:2-iminoacetate synthase
VRSRRVNANVAPLTLTFHALNHGDWTYNYSGDLSPPDVFESASEERAQGRLQLARDRDGPDTMQAGIDDVGIGVLFGLADWRYDLLAMMQHPSPGSEVRRGSTYD